MHRSPQYIFSHVTVTTLEFCFYQFCSQFGVNFKCWLCTCAFCCGLLTLLIIYLWNRDQTSFEYVPNYYEANFCTNENYFYLSPGPAYLDARNPKQVFIRVLLFGPSDLDGKESASACGLVINHQQVIQTRSVLDLINVLAGTEHCWSYYMNCELPDYMSDASKVSHVLVSLYPNADQVFVPVQQVPANVSQYDNVLSICLATPFFGFADWRRFMFFIEYHRFIGVERFIVYREGSTDSNELNYLMIYYTHVAGIMELVDWKPSEYNEFNEITYHAQSLTMNDCILRLPIKSVGKTKFLALIDYDELIGSYKHEMHVDWLYDYMLKLDAKYPKTAGFLIRNAFVETTLGLRKLPKKRHRSFEGMMSAALRHLNMLNSEFAMHDVLAEGERSKVIVRPESVLKQGVHVTFQTVLQTAYDWFYGASDATLTCSTSYAVLFHQRFKHEIEDIYDFDPVQNVTSMRPIADRLTSQILRVCHEIDNMYDAVMATYGRKTLRSNKKKKTPRRRAVG